MPVPTFESLLGKKDEIEQLFLHYLVLFLSFLVYSETFALNLSLSLSLSLSFFIVFFFFVFFVGVGC